MSGSSPPLSRTSSPSPDPLLLSHPASRAPDPACRLVEVRGVEVASFTVDGAELVCLPQVFQLFLRHLVGGLHTVYTKLRRLDIRPVVCTVEQVRVLRGLGVIQPGVNRCKLISRAEFETLYRDCTTASSRPGRPPKRTLGVAMMTDGSRLLPHGLVGSGLLSQTGAAAALEVLKLQRMRMMMMRFHGNRQSDATGGSEGCWEKERLPPSSPHRLSNFPFMVMPHPLLPVGLPPAGVAMPMNQMSKLSKGSPPGSPASCPSPNDDKPREPTSQSESRASSSSSSPPPDTHTPEQVDSLKPHPLLKPTYEKLPLTSQQLSINHTSSAFAPFLLAEGLTPMEMLLTNIQGLLKVAVDSVRCQDNHNQLERAELKLELDRERDARETLQRQLSSELQSREWIQKRLKKEKKVKKKLLEALESTRTEELVLTGSVTPGTKQEVCCGGENQPQLF